ncbi:hypothetical protein [Streptomyces sp. NPDC056188]|uniref:hypothetical protein n=1 Tax=Streptomyces sp. NPDC056188 TaxID=3345740 RepID=UPI0035E01AC5
MSQFTTALVGAGAAVGVGSAMVVWSWLQPTGKHRAPAAPRQSRVQVEVAGGGAVLDDVVLERLLDTGEVVANESAPCPCCGRTTFHAMHRDGSRRCWTCGTETGPGGVS